MLKAYFFPSEPTQEKGVRAELPGNGDLRLFSTEDATFLFRDEKEKNRILYFRGARYFLILFFSSIVEGHAGGGIDTISKFSLVKSFLTLWFCR